MAEKFLNHLILSSNSDFMVPFFALYSKIFPRNHKLQPNGSFEKGSKVS